ncbi:MAG: peptide chain release factor N(5)-glutamine methyltransferase [Gammaproteobacteria bacterium]|nr:peptide chain release factor N(5)-glutamine methyltransferase [Gammaproteobacteria bacterium]
MPNIKQQLERATKALYSISCSAALDSEVLLAFCLQKNRSYLLTWPEKELSSDQLECFHELVRKRLQPQPVAYLTGSREFYSMELNTTPATLVPRPETEMLVDKVLELIAELDSPKILELGTGTGAISLALKKHAHSCEILATDISQAALKVAQSNAQKHHLDISFVESNWYQSIPQDLFDVIVSNPPYIAASDPYLGQGDLPAEPLMALSSGETGLESLKTIIQQASAFLQPAGWIVLEHGYDQQQAVTELLLEYGFREVETLRDFNDLARLTLARR